VGALILIIVMLIAFMFFLVVRQSAEEGAGEATQLVTEEVTQEVTREVTVEPPLTQSEEQTSSRTHPSGKDAPAGEAYLDLWARTLEQYRRNTNAFFCLYAGQPHRTNEKKDENRAKFLSSPGLWPLCSCEGTAPRPLSRSLRLL
jgi:hypothetical protein